MVYKTSFLRWWEEAALLTGFTSLLVANVWLVAIGETVTLIFLPLWLMMASLTLLVSLSVVHTVKFLSNGLVLKSCRATTRIDEGDVLAVHEYRSGSNSAVVVFAGGVEYTVPVSKFEDRNGLVRRLLELGAASQTNAIEAALQSCRKFKCPRYASCMVEGVALFLAAGGAGLVVGVPRIAPLGWAIAAMGGLLVLLAIGSRKWHVQVSHQGIAHKGWKRREVLWHEVQHVRLSSPRIEYSRKELIEIVTHAKPLIVWDAYEDFPLLREVVLEMVPMEKVEDARRN